jgi:CBS domain-containing protein
MFSERVRNVMQKGRKLLKASPGTFVATAAKRMAARNVGAILVVEGDRLVGIFTERDVVGRVVAPGLDARATRLGDVMTGDVQTVHPDKPFGYAMVVMHEGGFRHLPVVEDGKLVGIVSSRSALDPELDEFAAETNRREHFMRMRRA